MGRVPNTWRRITWWQTPVGPLDYDILDGALDLGRNIPQTFTFHAHKRIAKLFQFRIALRIGIENWVRYSPPLSTFRAFDRQRHSHFLPQRDPRTHAFDAV